MPAILQRIEGIGLFSQIRDSAYAYPVVLGLHLLALMVWGGTMLITDLRLLGWGLRNEPLAEVIEGLRWPKRLSFILAALLGVLLFGAKAGQYSYNAGFWIKQGLLALLAANYLILRRGASGNGTGRRIK